MLIWIFLLFLGIFKAESANMIFYKSTDDYIKTPLTAPLEFINATNIDFRIKTIIYTFGFEAKVNGDVTILIKNSYLKYSENNSLNYILLDWEEEASAAFTIVEYPTKGIYYTKKLGNQLGDFLLTLSDHGLDFNKLHLVAHSLGAHMMGYAGKRTKKQGKTIQRITGLDPAGPLFTGLLSLPGLESEDAIFVDVVHSNPAKLGTSDSIGDVDIWINCDMKLQPGCPEGTFQLLSEEGRCSHIRAPQVFAESLLSPFAFPAIKADSCGDWLTVDTANGVDKHINYIGEDSIDTELLGNFYLRVGGSPPYSKGPDGIQP